MKKLHTKAGRCSAQTGSFYHEMLYFELDVSNTVSASSYNKTPASFCTNMVSRITDTRSMGLYMGT